MYGQHVAAQTQNERTSSLIRGAKCLTGARIATFGVSALMVGQLLLPSAALAAETPEPTAGQDVAAVSVVGSVESGVAGQVASTLAAPAAVPDAAVPTAVEAEPTPAFAPVNEAAPAAALDTSEPAAAVALVSEPAVEPGPTSGSAAASSPAPTLVAAPTSRGASDVPGGSGPTIKTTVKNHFYDLELPPAFTLIQGEAFVYDFPDAPEDFTLWRNESVHFFKIDPDTKALIKTENPEEANVSISLTVIDNHETGIDNHERATLVFTGGDADPLISYSLNLLHQIHIGANAEFDFSNFNFQNGEGTILETRNEYYIRCIFGSSVHLIATDTTDPEPDPDVKPSSASQPNAEKLATEPASNAVAAVVKPADSVTPATGDSGAMAAALGAAAAAAATAAAAVVGARRRNR